MPGPVVFASVTVLLALFALFACGLLGWLLLRHVLPRLLARFDGRALRLQAPPGTPEPQAAPLDPAQQVAWRALAAWCQVGAEERPPWWRPGARTALAQPCSVALLRGQSPARKRQVAEALAHQRDGSDRLDAAPGHLPRLLLRLRVKWDDCRWWRARQSADVWDCGYLGADADGHEALRHFQPRRATLVLVSGLPPQRVREAVLLLARSPAFDHPLRLLWLDAPAAAGAPELPGNTELVLDAA